MTIVKKQIYSFIIHRYITLATDHNQLPLKYLDLFA